MPASMVAADRFHRRILLERAHAWGVRPFACPHTADLNVLYYVEILLLRASRLAGESGRSDTVSQSLSSHAYLQIARTLPRPSIPTSRRCWNRCLCAFLRRWAHRAR